MHRSTPSLIAACSLALVLLPSALRADEPPTKPAAANNAPHWSSFITPQQLHARLQHPALLIIDVRTPREYVAGHIPGAINLLGVDWRTPPAAPGSGNIGQQIFRRPDGSVDVPRYEKFLGDAGLKQDHEVVIYGNHAGKADGSLPAALLLTRTSPSSTASASINGRRPATRSPPNRPSSPLPHTRPAPIPNDSGPTTT